MKNTKILSEPYNGLSFLLLALLWFGSIGAWPLQETTEARYGLVAQEMLLSGDWLTPYLNTFPFFDKPPIHYWGSALMMHIFGIHEWSARFFSSLCSFLGILLLYYTVRHVSGKRIALMATAILTGTLYYTFSGHVNYLDNVLAFFLQWTITAVWLRWNHQDRLCGKSVITNHLKKDHTVWLFWVGMALAFLTKGLIGIIFPVGLVIAVGTYESYMDRCWRPLRQWLIWMLSPKAIVLFILISAPWFILMHLQHPDFLHVFFIQEHFQRFTSTVHNRVEPWYYLIFVLFLGSLPWSVWVFFALINGIRQIFISILYRPTIKKHLDSISKMPSTPNMIIVISTVWIVMIVLFFSLSHSKLPGYIMPVFPPLAWLAALQFQRWQDNASLHVRHCWATGITLLLLALLLGFILTLSQEHANVPNYVHPKELQTIQYYLALLILLLGFTVGVPAIVGTLSQKPMKSYSTILANRWRWCLATLLPLIAFQIVMIGVSPYVNKRSANLLAYDLRTILTTLNHRDNPIPETHIPVYMFKMFDRSFLFYLQRPVTLVVPPLANELMYGLRQQTEKFLPTEEAFMKQWEKSAQQPAYGIILKSEWARLNKKISAKIISEDHHYYLFGRH